MGMPYYSYEQVWKSIFIRAAPCYIYKVLCLNFITLGAYVYDLLASSYCLKVEGGSN